MADGEPRTSRPLPPSGELSPVIPASLSPTYLAGLHAAVKDLRPGRLRNCGIIFSSHLDVERLGGSRGAEAAPQILSDLQHTCVLRLPVTGLDPHNICIPGGSQLLGSRQVLGLQVKLDVAAAVMLIAYLAARTRNQSTCD